MLNGSASLAMSTSILKALPGKLDIERHSPSILYFPAPKTKKVRKADGNVMMLKMEILEEEPNVVTGDPVQCKGCQAILSAISVLEREGDQSTWVW